MFLAGLFSGILIIGLFLTFVFPRMLFTVSESKFNFEQTAEVLTESVSTNKWNMPHQYDLQQIMAKNGFEVKPVKVFSICKPDIAVRILRNDDDVHVAAMMPCRIAIFEKADGKTYISLMNAGLIAKLMSGRANAVITDAADGSENILKGIIK